ncbi:Rap1a/Tai family immunity protein [Aliikangiella sp. G2MR2-5]|uniref:Rap1a/Tai family immunity protein n=1 Tax=Aliikangiella sp. G2MR2-5 TaxID=2788943 RepID=UPI0018AC842F|nr:Rap1a/Tai family immunity protein [Aliikangiella sp. G2MR2-5]
MNILSKFCILLLTSALAFSLSFSAKGLTPLSSEELSELCKNSKPKLSDPQSAQCVRYIKGFIDGLLATKRVSIESQQESSERSSFMERAIKTRIGNRIEYSRANPDEQVCLTRAPSLKEIVHEVAGEIQKQDHDQTTALTAVYQALVENYPC